jgi:hypothetical protein
MPRCTIALAWRFAALAHLPAPAHAGAHQVFLLTKPDDPQTLRLARPIMHRTSGRGSAWAQGPRYTGEHALKRGPETTDDLAAE